MRDPAVMFRLPGHLQANLDALAKHLNTSPNLIAKLIVIREITQIPAMLEEHEKQLGNMHHFLQEMALRNEQFLAEDGDRTEAAEAIMAKLDEVMLAMDSIRDSAIVRPSTYIEDLIKEHDERPVQESLAV
ncbi:hypothetical protein ACFHWW_26745 [Ensifer sp. P24N7]|uniref:hypothetical protein n=1 Tax=Sinorhizobium sp. P24N7 TaxID=3348358 RepID=UPI0035F3C767